MLITAHNLNLNPLTWTRHDSLKAARTFALTFNDIRVVVLGSDGLYWVVSARDAGILRKSGFETI
jgi:hypothetical protein